MLGRQGGVDGVAEEMYREVGRCALRDFAWCVVLAAFCGVLYEVSSLLRRLFV